jgi:O-antigen ligase/polysaccharide polymerase Wzy-like membrane protein
VFAALAFHAGGGLQLGPLTGDEIALQVAAGAIGVVAVLAGAGRLAFGATAGALMVGLAVLTGVSVIWSIDPAGSWIETNRTLTYAAVFLAGIALVRLAAPRWASLLGATVIAAVAVCGYAVLTKTFPGALNPDEAYARLREPFGYWNAVGLTAALGVPGCLWLGARRSGHAALNALAFPALGLLVLTMLLAYSRGSLLAAALGAAFWFALVPLRLRGFAVLATSALGAALVAVWSFAQDGLSTDRAAPALRSSAGHELGVALVAMLLTLTAAGLAIGFLQARHPLAPRVRRRAGIAILAALALVPVVAAGALALSARGLTGSLSHGWTQLTDPHATVPSNAPGRLTAVGSVRALYWNQALKIFQARPLVGAGAGGYATARPQFRDDTLDVRHAHGYVVQTLADLGITGLLVSFALLGAWLLAAVRATGLYAGAVRTPFSAERAGLVTLFAVVVVFGVHSFIDWTWFVPGTAVVALLCAGWLAGRGPVAGVHGGVGAQAFVHGLKTSPRAILARDPLRRAGGPARGALRPAGPAVAEPLRLAAAAAIAVVTVATAWATYQPLRSVHAGEDALSALEAGRLPEARAKALDARSINPLSVEPYFELATVEVAAGRPAAARTALVDAALQQPSSPKTWIRLAEFDLGAGRPRQAIDDLGPALALDPRSPVAIQTFLDANRRLATARQPRRRAATR